MLGNNKLLGGIVFVFATLVVAVVLINRSNEQGEPAAPPSAGGARPIPENVGPAGPTGNDATTDTTAETLTTVAAQYQSMETRVDELTRAIQEQQTDPGNEGSEEEISAIVKRELDLFMASVESLQQARGDLSSGTTGNPSSVTDSETYTVDSTDFGFAPGTLGEPQVPQGYEAIASTAGYVRVQPLYTLRPSGQSVVDIDQQSDQPSADVQNSLAPVPSSPESPSRVPVATIPKNATLYNATAFTALVGRVPLGGSVSDPMPVKVVIGTENLAANGHRIDGLKGTVFSGTAIGDWTLGCVRVALNSATFVFDDNSFTTLSSNSLSESFSDNGFGGSDSAGNEQQIGWISDRQGVPCVKGQKLTDAPKRIGVLALLGGAQGAADAYAEAQETTTVSQGTTTSSVTGSNTNFLIGNTVAEGISSATSDISTRFNDSFDAIYVPAGETVVVHIDQTLTIDRVSNARKLNYTASYNDQIFLD